MQIGIIGLPLSGKTTVFNLLTEGTAATGGAGGRQQVNVGVARVPDERLEFLASLFHPRKVTPATIQFTDLAGFVPGERDRGRLNDFLQAVRRSDALLHVVRAFADPAVPHALGRVDPARDAADLEAELILADLDLAEKALARLRAQRRPAPAEARQAELLETCRAALEDGRPVRRLSLDPEDEKLLRGYAFLTARPMLLAVNLDEAQLERGDYPGREALREYAAGHEEELVELAGRVEMEIASLDPAERASFLAGYGLEEPGIARLARAAYRALGLISFLTAGEDEVRAWPVRRGATAREAAGRIHSDMERGFIRAEVIAFDDLRRAGSVRAARERGSWRLEGRDYVVQDGDVFTFRFHV